jgi:hypothetical protein
MKNRIYQLEGQDRDLALFEVPSEIKDVQQCFDEAFAAAENDEDETYILDEASEYLEENFNIVRIYIQDYVFTNKL